MHIWLGEVGGEMETLGLPGPPIFSVSIHINQLIFLYYLYYNNLHDSLLFSKKQKNI